MGSPCPRDETLAHERPSAATRSAALPYLSWTIALRSCSVIAGLLLCRVSSRTGNRARRALEGAGDTIAAEIRGAQPDERQRPEQEHDGDVAERQPPCEHR